MGASSAWWLGASCCVACGVLGVPWGGVVLTAPVSVRRRLWGGEGVVRGWGVMACWGGLGVMSQMSQRRVSPPFRLLEGLPQAPEDVWVVLGCGELVGVYPLGAQRIGQHGFPCVLRHPSPRQPEFAVLRCVPARPAHLEGISRGGPFPRLPQLCVGPALPPRPWGGSQVVGVGVGMGVGVGVGACCWVGGLGGGGWSGGVRVLIGLCPGRAWGAGVARGPRGLRLRVGAGSAAVAVVGHLRDVGRHAGLVWGRGYCWLLLLLPRHRYGRGWRLADTGRGLRAAWGRGAPCFCCGPLCHEGGGGGVGDGGESHWPFLLPGLLRLW